jgi:hypothetical protein
VNNKAKREIKTLRVMIEIYCRDKHGTKGQLCSNCEELFNYARERIVNCKLGDQKTTCAQCKIHCFKPIYREQIRQVMSYAGPKMIFKHSYLAFCHLLDSHFKINSHQK